MSAKFSKTYHHLSYRSRHRGILILLGFKNWSQYVFNFAVKIFEKDSSIIALKIHKHFTYLFQRMAVTNGDFVSKIK